MKAKIKETGQEIEVMSVYASLKGYATHYDIEDISFDEKKDTESSIDYEQRRFQLVIAAMQGYISNEGREYMHTESSMKNTAELCVKFADAVLAEYNKGTER